MNLSNDLISQFVKITNDKTKKNENVTSYGTVVKYNNAMYVKLDGSDLLTPVDSSSVLHENDRVLVDIGGHKATVSGNISNPSVSGIEIKNVEDSLQLEFSEQIKNLDLIFKNGFDVGVTSVDINGLTVTHTAYNGYTKMTYEGFFVNDGDGNVLTCTKDGLTYSGTISSSSIKGGTISINDNFIVNSDGDLTTNSYIRARGGVYTYQDIRGLDSTNKTGGLTLVTGTGNLAVRTEDSNYSVYLQSASGEVKVTAPSDPNTFANLRAYDLLANNAVYANGVNVSSDKNRKRDIELYNVDALNEIYTTPVYTYHLDVDLDEELKRIGIIMQEAPLDAIDLKGTGVDLYQMTCMLWRAIQQLYDKIK